MPGAAVSAAPLVQSGARSGDGPSREGIGKADPPSGARVGASPVRPVSSVSNGSGSTTARRATPSRSHPQQPNGGPLRESLVPVRLRKLSNLTISNPRNRNFYTTNPYTLSGDSGLAADPRGLTTEPGSYARGPPPYADYDCIPHRGVVAARGRPPLHARPPAAAPAPSNDVSGAASSGGVQGSRPGSSPGLARQLSGTLSRQGSGHHWRFLTARAVRPPSSASRKQREERKLQRREEALYEQLRPVSASVTSLDATARPSPMAASATAAPASSPPSPARLDLSPRSQQRPQSPPPPLPEHLQDALTRAQRCLTPERRRLLGEQRPAAELEERRQAAAAAAAAEAELQVAVRTADRALQQQRQQQQEEEHLRHREEAARRRRQQQQRLQSLEALSPTKAVGAAHRGAPAPRLSLAPHTEGGSDGSVGAPSATPSSPQQQQQQQQRQQRAASLPSAFGAPPTALDILPVEHVLVQPYETPGGGGDASGSGAGRQQRLTAEERALARRVCQRSDRTLLRDAALEERERQREEWAVGLLESYCPREAADDNNNSLGAGSPAVPAGGGYAAEMRAIAAAHDDGADGSAALAAALPTAEREEAEIARATARALALSQEGSASFAAVYARQLQEAARAHHYTDGDRARLAEMGSAFERNCRVQQQFAATHPLRDAAISALDPLAAPSEPRALGGAQGRGQTRRQARPRTLESVAGASSSSSSSAAAAERKPKHGGGSDSAAAANRGLSGLAPLPVPPSQRAKRRAYAAQERDAYTWEAVAAGMPEAWARDRRARDAVLAYALSARSGEGTDSPPPPPETIATARAVGSPPGSAAAPATEADASEHQQQRQGEPEAAACRRVALPLEENAEMRELLEAQARAVRELALIEEAEIRSHKRPPGTAV